MYIGQPYSSPEEALAHYGVKGMHWGVRKDRTPGVSARTDREARKDAKEFARAKMFYGEGAGTRRKLINKSVEAKAKRDPAYKKAFERHLDKQDLSTHAQKARSERRRKDTKAKVGRGVRGTRHILNGNTQYASAVTAMLVGGALAAHRAGIDRLLFDLGSKKYSDIRRGAGVQGRTRGSTATTGFRRSTSGGGKSHSGRTGGGRTSGSGLNRGKNESAEDFIKRMMGDG